METKRNPLSIDRWRRGGLLKDLRRRRTVSGLAAYELMEPSGPEREKERERERERERRCWWIVCIADAVNPRRRPSARPASLADWVLPVFFYWVLPSRANGFARVGLSWLVGSWSGWICVSTEIGLSRSWDWFTGFYWVSMGCSWAISRNGVVTGFNWDLPGYTGFYWIIPGFTGFFWVKMSFTGLYWVLLFFSGLKWVLMDYIGFKWVLLGYTGFYWVLLLFFLG